MRTTRNASHTMRHLIAGLCAGAILAGCGSSDDPTHVVTDKGAVRGIETATARQFLGIPYAAPPTGALRWKPPQAAAAWEGVRDASKFASHCAQPASPFGIASTSEDCLYLNVYTPKGTGPFPVMVWIHGGALLTGEGDDYDPSNLIDRGVAVVTLNYRLGALGFLTHPALTAESADHASGNYGLMDQQAALRWVKTNIAAFGGDPNNVTIFGESAGGLSTHSQIASPLSAGLFHKAIVESGSYSLIQPPLAAAEALGQKFATQAGCTDQSAACLRSLSIDKLIANESAIQAGGTTLPTVDGKVLPLSLVAAFSTGTFNKVPVIEGTNSDEYTLLSAATIDPVLGHAISTPTEYSAFRDPLVAAFGKTPAQADAVYPTANYPTLASAYDAIATDAIFSCNGRTIAKMLSASVPVYAYEFNDQNAPMPFKLPPRPSFGAYHSAEIQYIFPDHNPIVYGAPFTQAQQALSSQMVDFWTRFAKSGNPNAGGSSAWPQYSAGSDTYMSLQPSGSATTTGFAAKHNCTFWTGA